MLGEWLREEVEPILGRRAIPASRSSIRTSSGAIRPPSWSITIAIGERQPVVLPEQACSFTSTPKNRRCSGVSLPQPPFSARSFRCQ
jgi:hypothetical protein